MPIVFEGIILTAISVFSLWGGTPVPVARRCRRGARPRWSALTVALGVGVTFFGLTGRVRGAGGQDEPPSEATSPHRSD